MPLRGLSVGARRASGTSSTADVSEMDDHAVRQERRIERGERAHSGRERRHVCPSHGSSAASAAASVVTWTRREAARGRQLRYELTVDEDEPGPRRLTKQKGCNVGERDFGAGWGARHARSGAKSASAIGATLVKCQSSSRRVGNPAAGIGRARLAESERARRARSIAGDETAKSSRTADAHARAPATPSAGRSASRTREPRAPGRAPCHRTDDTPIDQHMHDSRGQCSSSSRW